MKYKQIDKLKVNTDISREADEGLCQSDLNQNEESVVRPEGGDAVKSQGMEEKKFVPVALEGVQPLLTITESANLVKNIEDVSNIAESNLSTDRSKSNAEPESQGEISGLEDVADNLQILKQLKITLQLSPEEESACLQLLSIMRRYPDVLINVACRLDSQVSKPMRIAPGFIQGITFLLFVVGCRKTCWNMCEAALYEMVVRLCVLHRSSRGGRVFLTLWTNTWP